MNKIKKISELFGKDDFTGFKFGRLTVIEKVSGEKWDTRWLCKCDCGNTKVVDARNLKYNITRSCGCFRREATIKRLTTHNEGKRKLTTKEYRAWCSMIERCVNPNAATFKLYGGRGIKICKRWRHSYQKFLNDVGRAPTPQHTLDRFPNNDGDYKPSNVRWATKRQQANNRRTNVFITHNGETLNLSEWNKRLGLKDYVFNNARIRGKSLEAVLLKHINK